MLRKLCCLFLLLAAFGQGLALASARAPTEGLARALAHAQEPSHHHHDDGELHLEDADASSFHVHLDGGSNPAAIASAWQGSAAPKLSQAPPSGPSSTLPTPPLAGLLRPPRPGP